MSREEVEKRLNEIADDIHTGVTVENVRIRLLEITFHISGAFTPPLVTK